jgi:AcrR family transcriptional regulator
MKEKDRILEQTEAKFFRDGFYKTTMDEIAVELRMSKKTIYKFFPSKDDLVKAITKFFMNKMKNRILPVLNSEKNAIEKLGDLINVLAKASERISAERLEDLKKYYPSLWNEIDKFRTEMMFGNITKVIEQGKKEGLFVDYPTIIIMQVLVASVRSIVNPDFILNNNFSIIEAARFAFRIVITGILTDKGKKEFNKSFSKVLQ